jgi:hypothetical protein
LERVTLTQRSFLTCLVRRSCPAAAAAAAARLQRYQFQAAGGWLKLQHTVTKQFGSEDHPYTRLVPDLQGPVPETWQQVVGWE